MKKLFFSALFCSIFFTVIAAPKHADILFTADIHSFLDNSSKIKTLVDRQKAINPNTLVVDGGDFSMGTLFQTIFENHASELRTLGLIGIDATTIGNHEFDYGAESLSNMFNTALTSNDPLPSFVLCNADWKKDNEYTKTVKSSLVDNYGSKDYMMIQKGDVSIAVIGVFGKEAFLYSPTCEMTFEDPISAVKRTVDNIKAHEKADLIVCLSHSGIYLNNINKAEDVLLAKGVPELDVIISAHSHTKLDEPLIYGDTIIGSCEAYNKYLGNISLTQKENGRWKLDSYSLTDLSADIPKDPYIEERLKEFSELINNEYLNLFGLKKDQILTTSNYDYDINSETGYLMAEAVYNTVDGLGEPVDVAIVPSGVLRGTYNKGPITVSEVFDSYSLGIGNDGLTGYPLIGLYISGKELKNVAEIDCSLSGIMNTVRLFTYGFKYTYNPRRLILDKVLDCSIIDKYGNEHPVEDNKLYRVITDMYTGMMIGGITGTTKGLITIVPKFSDGSEVKDFSDTIIRKRNGDEQKGWLAIAEYFEGKETLPSYSDAESKYIISEASFAPSKLFKNPSKLYIILRIVLLCIIILVTGIIILCKKLKKK